MKVKRYIVTIGKTKVKKLRKNLNELTELLHLNEDDGNWSLKRTDERFGEEFRINLNSWKGVVEK